MVSLFGVPMLTADLLIVEAVSLPPIPMPIPDCLGYVVCTPVGKDALAFRIGISSGSPLSCASAMSILGIP
jgi:hypothetical protein